MKSCLREGLNSAPCRTGRDLTVGNNCFVERTCIVGPSEDEDSPTMTDVVIEINRYRSVSANAPRLPDGQGPDIVVWDARR